MTDEDRNARRDPDRETTREAAPTRQRPSRDEVLRDMRLGASRVANILAVVVTTAAAIFAGILVLHIVFVLFDANAKNTIVKHINTYAHDLAGPFRDLFTFKHKVKGRTQPNLKLADTVNYGIAAVAYLFGGRIIASLLHRLAPEPTKK